MCFNRLPASGFVTFVPVGLRSRVNLRVSFGDLKKSVFFLALCFRTLQTVFPEKSLILRAVCDFQEIVWKMCTKSMLTVCTTEEKRGFHYSMRYQRDYEVRFEY